MAFICTAKVFKMSSLWRRVSSLIIRDPSDQTGEDFPTFNFILRSTVRTVVVIKSQGYVNHTSSEIF